MSTTPAVISRLVSASTAHNTLSLPPAVPIFLQRSPDAPTGAARGIDGVDFQVTSGGTVIQSGGKTGADGRIDVRVPPGGSSTLQLLSAPNGTVLAEYEVTVDSGALDAANTVQGQQERLRMLGYQIGHSGADGNGVDNTANATLERSILDFQADQTLTIDAIAGPQTQGRLTTRAGG